MKLCFLADGIQEHTRRWTRFFGERGHDVHLITWNPEHLPDYAPVQVHVVNKPFRGPGSGLLNLWPILGPVKRLFREIKPDVVHAHSANAYAWVAMLSGHHPYVVTPWGTDLNIHLRGRSIGRVLADRSLRKADLVTVDANFMKGQLMARGVDENKIRLLMFGVDFRRLEGHRSAGAAADSPALSRPVIVSTRLLTPERGVETIVRATPRVIEAFPQATFVFVGSGAQREELEQLTVTLGTRRSVHFTGHVTEREMIRWLCAGDVYVSASLTDAGLAASTAEAMACGLAVVTTDNSENSLWVHEGLGGYLIPNGDAVALADRLIQLLRAPGQAAEMGQYNARLIKHLNNYEVEMEKMERLYQRLAAS